jgi:hypothetical protein
MQRTRELILSVTQRMPLAMLLKLRFRLQWKPRIPRFTPHKPLPMRRLRSPMQRRILKQRPRAKPLMLRPNKLTRIYKTKDRSS